MGSRNRYFVVAGLTAAALVCLGFVGVGSARVDDARAMLALPHLDGEVVASGLTTRIRISGEARETEIEHGWLASPPPLGAHLAVVLNPDDGRLFPIEMFERSKERNLHVARVALMGAGAFAALAMTALVKWPAHRKS